jgi:hypothetical protein
MEYVSGVTREFKIGKCEAEQRFRDPNSRLFLPYYYYWTFKKKKSTTTTTRNFVTPETKQRGEE